jgi:lysyl-tRNA synthetase class 2
MGYNDSTKILEIEFQNGLVYQFLEVPPKIYADLVRSAEIGKYFTDKVRTKFKSKQVSV